jgi:hypothetical protein
MGEEFSRTLPRPLFGSSTGASSLRDALLHPGDRSTPLCNRCKSRLTAVDRKKTKKSIDGGFFKACKRCRDKGTLARRKERAKKSLAATEPNIYTADHKPARDEVECSTCAESLPAEDFPSLSACEHKPDVCRSCLLAWLAASMDSTVWENIECPSSGCKSHISHEDVKTHAPQDVFARYLSQSFVYCQSDINSFTGSTTSLFATS